MRSPVTRIAIVVTALIAATVGLLILAMLQQTKVSCEVCISFRGRTQCRTALGHTRDFSAAGMSVRGKRFVMVVEDWLITYLAVDESGLQDTSAEACLGVL